MNIFSKNFHKINIKSFYLRFCGNLRVVFQAYTRPLISIISYIVYTEEHFFNTTPTPNIYRCLTLYPSCMYLKKQCLPGILVTVNVEMITIRVIINHGVSRRNIVFCGAVIERTKPLSFSLYNGPEIERIVRVIRLHTGKGFTGELPASSPVVPRFFRENQIIVFSCFSVVADIDEVAGGGIGMGGGEFTCVELYALKEKSKNGDYIII